ncbi:MAG: hypothetical protein JW714_05045 [Candidatus Omnitrophica bacterium]|nr:hypothetical protein [Candidatus Omnitrophota bacterium]
MKAKEKKLARKLRRAGWSVRTIAKQIACSKSSISTWVRDIPLTTEQIKRLKSNQDKARAKAAQHPNSPKQKWLRIRTEIAEKSSREIPIKFSKLDLKILGTALYWAEGYNASRHVFLFANSNPNMIKIMMKFLKDICRVPKEKVKGRINIHPHLDLEKAERFWLRVTKISKNNLNKPLLAVSKASKQKRDSLPLGTFNIIVCDVVLASRIKGWIKGLAKWAVGAAG